jgi:CBS domain-containing protein
MTSSILCKLAYFKREFIMKKTVSELLKQKDLSNIPSIDHTGTLQEALYILDETNTGSLLVMRGLSIIGIFSERDFARASAFRDGALPMETKVTDLMSKSIVYVTPDYSLDECMAVMCKMKVRHLPVLLGDTPIALLSMRHIMEAIVEENEFMIGQLVAYITGGPSAHEKTNRNALIME